MARILSMGALQPTIKISYVPADKGQRLESDLPDKFIHEFETLFSQSSQIHSYSLPSSYQSVI